MDLRTEEFFKTAKINSLISMALLYSKNGTCYFIKLIFTFIINCRIFVKHHQHIDLPETTKRKLAESFLWPRNRVTNKRHQD